MRTSRFMELITKRAKLFNIYLIALLLIVPIAYILNQIITLPLFNIIINICIFFFFFGHYTFKFLMKLFLKLLKMNSIQIKGIFSFTFSIISGVLLNVFYGTVLMYLGLLQYSAYYILFECTALVFLIEEYKSILHARVEIKYKKADIMQLSFLLFPIFVVILLNFYYMPYPYFSAWDLFFYQGIAIQIANGKVFLLYANLDPFSSVALRPIGFMIILSVVYISTRIPLTFLIEFDKMAVFFAYATAILLVYLISYKISKSRFASMIITLVLIPYNGSAALGPSFFLPSSFSWITSLIAVYVITLYIETREHESGLKLNNSFLILILILLMCFNFFFHFFTAMIFIFVLIISVVFINQKLKKLRILIYLIVFFAAIYVFAGRVVNIPVISQILVAFFGTNQYWSLQGALEFFDGTFSFTVIIMGVIGSFFILQYKKFDNYKWMIINFLLFLIIFFMPLYATYRVQFMILIFWVCIFSLIARIVVPKLIDVYRNGKSSFTLLNYTISFTFTVAHVNHGEMKKKRFLNKIINSRRLREKRSEVIIVTLLILFQLVNIAALSSPLKNMFFDGKVGHYIESTYSPAEYDGIQWINYNLKPNDYVVLTDYGTAIPFFGMTDQAYAFINEDIPTWNLFRSILSNCTSSGMNVTQLSQVIANVNAFLGITMNEYHYLLLITTRTFYSLIHNFATEIFANTAYINYTRLEYIGNTPNITKIFNNTEVFLFNITSF